MKRSELKRTLFRAEPKPSKGVKLKTCKVCREKFEPRMPLQKACSVACSIIDGKRVTAQQKAKAAKHERAQDKAKLESMKPAKWWKAKAKTAMHTLALGALRYGRLRASV